MPEFAKIKIAAEHGTLKIVSNYSPASKTINGVNVEVEFRTNEWTDLTKKIVFYKNNQSYEYSIPVSGIISIPSNVLDRETGSEFEIGIYGASSSTTLTTNRVEIHINIGCVNGINSLLSVTPVLGTYNGISTIEGEIGTIKMAVNHGTLRMVKNYIPASQTVNGVKVEFEFESDEWNSLIKTVGFYRGKESYGVVITGSKNYCMIPWEILNVESDCECDYSINIIGTADGIVLPTQRVKMKMNIGGYNSIIYGTEPTPSIYDQISALVANKQDKLIAGDNITIDANNRISAVAPEGTHDKNYIHNQRSSSSEWRIVHNLNKYPSVSVVDSAGSLVVGDVEYISENVLIARFKSPFSGKAYIN